MIPASLSSFCTDPKKGSPGSSPLCVVFVRSCLRIYQMQYTVFKLLFFHYAAPALFSAGGCHRASKHRFASFLTVVHFRKVSDSVKVGSTRNRHPVIYWCCYKVANY